MWYYAIGTERKGPLAQADLEMLLRQGTVDGGTLVWREGMTDWLPASQTDLAAAAAESPVPNPIPYVEGRTDSRGAAAWRGPAPRYTPKSLDTLFIWWWVSAAVIGLAYVLIVAFVVVIGRGTNSSGGNVALAVIGGLLVLAAVVTSILCHCHLVYRMWEQVNDGRARTTPGRAVGYSFIPLFNIYWQFVAVYGLSLELNRVMDANGISGTRPNPQIALWYCVLSLTGLIPFIGILGSLGALVLGIMTWLQHKRAAQAILGWRQARVSQ